LRQDIFRCLTITATENKERSKGTITNQDNSGTAGDEVVTDVGVAVGVGEVETLLAIIVWVLLQPLVVKLVKFIFGASNEEVTV